MRKVLALDRNGQVRWTPKSPRIPRPPSAVRDTTIPHNTTVPLTDTPDPDGGTPKSLSKGSERPKTGYIHKRGRVGKFDMPVHTHLQRYGLEVRGNRVIGFMGLNMGLNSGPMFDDHVVTKLSNWNDLTTRLRGPHYLLMAEEQTALEDIIAETNDEGFQYRDNQSSMFKFCIQAEGEPVVVALDTGDYVAYSPKFRRLAGYQKMLVPVQKHGAVVSCQLGATVVTDAADSEEIQTSLLTSIYDEIIGKAQDTGVVNFMGMSEVYEKSPVHILADMVRLSLGAERVLSDL